MSAGKYNISIEQGVSWSKVLTLKNGAGTVINLTGYSARMQPGARSRTRRPQSR
jgi:hypothetical protein